MHRIQRKRPRPLGAPDVRSACSRAVLYAAGVLAALAASSMAATSDHPADAPASPDAPATTYRARPFRLVGPDVLQPLERPAVWFDHERHTAALEEESEGCATCHPTGDAGELLFTYPDVPVEQDGDAFMNAFHDGCVGCHQQRIDARKKAGPVTCGECHVVDRAAHRRAYLPARPAYYDTLRDIYHRNCLACHREPAGHVEEAAPLDWKSFHVEGHTPASLAWPSVAFDYLIHDKHTRALDDGCEKCHVLSEARKAQLAEEGREPEPRDWVWDAAEPEAGHPKHTAHRRCINCHLSNRAKGESEGPITCGACHTGAQRTREELADVPRIDCAQEAQILIGSEQDDRAEPPVPFDHAAHQASSRTCGECHHKTVRACRDCHSPEGKPEGDHITLAEAFHQPSSTHSCVGCHDAEKRKPDCAGCHQFREVGLLESACETCHTGTLEALEARAPLPPPEQLIGDAAADAFTIDVMASTYEPSSLPHLAIASRLTDISNASPLAAHFHVDRMTVCAGCHHLGPRREQETPAPCRTCHTIRDKPVQSAPTLLGAYHQQCLGCHQQMAGSEEDMPQACVGCHEEAQAE